MREPKPTRNLPETYQNPLPLPILSNIFFIKIDPGGMKFTMMISRPDGFGNVVNYIICQCFPVHHLPFFYPLPFCCVSSNRRFWFLFPCFARESFFSVFLKIPIKTIFLDIISIQIPN
jgi:hypothetical protein